MSKGNRWHPELCISITEVLRLHDEGLSTRKIAKVLGYAYSYIHKICQLNGRRRNKSEAGILASPPKSTLQRALHAQARRIVERTYNIKLASTDHVHHKDRNPKNNDLSNLQVIDNVSHAHLHHPPKHLDEFGNVIPRHLLPERKRYMKVYGAEYRKKRKKKK